MSKIERLLVDRYRPTDIKDYVFVNKEEEDKVYKWLGKRSIPNVLAYGPPGTGKTTLGRVIANELNLSDMDIKIINGSTVGVGFLREVLIPWMKRMPMGDFKMVIIEEIDRMTQDAMEVLRFEIEDASDTVRFYATANYINKVKPILLSRFQTVKIDSMNEEGVIDYVFGVVEKEGLTFDDDVILSYIDIYGPDIRKILNSIDERTSSDGVVLPPNGSVNSKDVDLWEAIWKDEGKLDLEQVLEAADCIDESNYDDFYRVMYENSNKLPDEVIGVVLISKYLDRAQHSANQQLHLKACIYHIFFMENGNVE